MNRRQFVLMVMSFIVAVIMWGYINAQAAEMSEGIVEVGIAPDGTVAHEYTSVINGMTAEERELLRKIVAAESQTQIYEGRMAVVEAILNRCINSTYPDTVGEVLSQKGQFSSYPYRDAKWVEPEYSDIAIDWIFRNGRSILPDTEYEYFSTGYPKGAKDVIKIDDHYFYKL